MTFRPSVMYRFIRFSRARFANVKVVSRRPIIPVIPRNIAREYSANASDDSSKESFLYDEDYHLLMRDTDAKFKQLLNSPTRYQPIEKREDQSDIPLSVIESICRGKYITKYRGALLWREPKELAILRHFFACSQPRTVIELGTFTGSSAIWFADTAMLLDLDCHVYSMDTDHSLISKDIKRINPEKVTFIEGDRSKIEEMLPTSLLQNLPHPWVVFEDSHADLFVGFKYLNGFMSEGDYVVAENSDPRMPHKPGLHVLFGKDEMVQQGTEKLELLRSFLKGHGQDYQVDSFYTDLYGYNCTPHWHGFLRKM